MEYEEDDGCSLSFLWAPLHGSVANEQSLKLHAFQNQFIQTILKAKSEIKTLVHCYEHLKKKYDPFLIIHKIMYKMYYSYLEANIDGHMCLQ